jgi:hypothetical protein
MAAQSTPCLSGGWKIDDSTWLRMDREAGQDALDLIRELMSMHVTLAPTGWQHKSTTIPLIQSPEHKARIKHK